MRQEMPLSQYHKMKYPYGRPTLETLRRWVKSGKLPGRVDPNEQRATYYVYTEVTTGDAETDQILKEIS